MRGNQSISYKRSKELSGKTSEELVEQMGAAGIIAGKSSTFREVSEGPIVRNKKFMSEDIKRDTEIVLTNTPRITPYL